MESQREIRATVESVVLPLLVLGANLFYRQDPGFGTLEYIPYLLVPLITSLFGLRFGFIGLGSTVLAAAVLLPFVLRIAYPAQFFETAWRSIATDALIPLAVTIVLVYMFGSIISADKRSVTRLRERVRELVKENHTLGQTADALSQVNLELEERVSGQQESITYLYNQIKKLDVLDLGKVLDALLETVQIFTTAERLSVWVQRGGMLEMVASRGHGERQAEMKRLPTEGTIEGWVLRNNSTFSIRMLLQYDNLKRMNPAENIITLPIMIERRSWGILRISAMPFLKYNLYSERVLQIIMVLAETAIARAIEYEALFRTDEIHDVTGLPLYSQLFRVLEDEMQKLAGSGTALSVILLELINFEDLALQHGNENVEKLFPDLVEILEELAFVNISAYHYKTETQLALIYPNLDFDGASLFCLEALEKVNSSNLCVGSEQVRLEVVIGYASFSGRESVEELLERAEHLMEIQKV